MSQLREDQILIKNARIGYPKLFKADAVKGDANAKPRFGCQIYLPKTDKEAYDRLNTVMATLVKTKLDGTKPKTKDLFIKDGDGDEGDENTKGCWIISANRSETQGRPTVIDRNKAPLAADDTKPYAGCRCNFLISVYVPKQWKKLCASLEIVQFWADDEPFGLARPDAGSIMPGGDEDDDII